VVTHRILKRSDDGSVLIHSLLLVVIGLLELLLSGTTLDKVIFRARVVGVMMLLEAIEPFVRIIPSLAFVTRVLGTILISKVIITFGFLNIILFRQQEHLELFLLLLDIVNLFYWARRAVVEVVSIFVSIVSGLGVLVPWFVVVILLEVIFLIFVLSEAMIVGSEVIMLDPSISLLVMVLTESDLF
jgi:hypothetical protein